MESICFRGIYITKLSIIILDTLKINRGVYPFLYLKLYFCHTTLNKLNQIGMNKFFYLVILFVVLLCTIGCKASEEKSECCSTKTVVKNEIVKTGLDILVESNFEQLKGKRVGLVTNPTGINRDMISNIDLLSESKDVELVALYSPEHGVRGDVTAGERVATYKDSKTGVTVFSLYGKNKKPSKEMLDGVDLLIYDIQDIGCRSYTYISTMGLVMEAAAENNIPFMVLDRPNPLGGLRVEGGLVEPGFESLVSMFPIPYVYGLTCGEVAMLINEEGMINGDKKCDLTVVKMDNWRRDMIFTDTKLPWVPTSPHIPNPTTAIYYPTTGIFGELYTISIGVGYPQPFELMATTWIEDADKLAQNLNALGLKGIHFRPMHFKPYYSVSKGEMVHGVQIHFTDLANCELSTIQFYILQEIHKLYPENNIFDLCEQSRWGMFDKVSGSDKVREQFQKNFLYEDIKEFWTKDVEEFKNMSKKYQLY